jgi:hypothetical protein
MKSLLCAAVVLGVAGTASATLVYHQSQPFAGELSPFGPTNLTFNQLDPSTLGLQPGESIVITQVVLTIEGSISANVAAENDNLSPAPNFGVTLTGFAQATLGAANASFNILQAANSGGVAGSDGVPESGPDYYNFGLLGDLGNDSAIILAGLGAYEGNGTFDATVLASGGFAVSGASNSSLYITDFTTEGSVSVDIYYKIIPTPGAMALFGLAGLTATRRRRG